MILSNGDEDDEDGDERGAEEERERVFEGGAKAGAEEELVDQEGEDGNGEGAFLRLHGQEQGDNGGASKQPGGFCRFG